jgi:hypothetical protein
MNALRISVIGASLSILLSSCAAIFCGPALDHGISDPGDIGLAVADRNAAVIIARAIWLSRHPESESESEAAWLKDYKAELWGGAWYVSPLDEKRSGPQMQIARRDGQLLDIAPVQ